MFVQINLMHLPTSGPVLEAIRTLHAKNVVFCLCVNVLLSNKLCSQWRGEGGGAVCAEHQPHASPHIWTCTCGTFKNKAQRKNYMVRSSKILDVTWQCLVRHRIKHSKTRPTTVTCHWPHWHCRQTNRQTEGQTKGQSESNHWSLTMHYNQLRKS